MLRRLPDQLNLFADGLSKRCVRCGLEKPIEGFAFRVKAMGKRLAHCRSCQAKYSRKHYEVNRKTYIDRAAATTRRKVQERWDRLVEFLADHACVDCGETDILVLEFDHLSDKAFNISWGVRNSNWAALIAEIEKCEVVCGNCHRRRTARKAGYWRTWSKLAVRRAGDR